MNFKIGKLSSSSFGFKKKRFWHMCCKVFFLREFFIKNLFDLTREKTDYLFFADMLIYASISSPASGSLLIEII
jgi:hypothetical protein